MSSISEFELIYRHLAPQSGKRSDVILGIGDDAAVVCPPSGHELVVALDTLVEKRHFFADCAAADLAWKALAVNLSDLAAMGAEPRWALMALSLPNHLAKTDWVDQFMHGWHSLAAEHDVALIGGDTTGSDLLSVSVTLMGVVPKGQSLLRSTAREGDDIWVSGSLGDAGLALAQLYAQQTPAAAIAQRLHRPSPRVTLGLALRGVATAAIDVSDGFFADLNHILQASGGLSAQCWFNQFSFSPEVIDWIGRTSNPFLPLSSGDDYELIFTASAQWREYLLSLSEQTGVLLSQVGCVGRANQSSKLLYQDQLLSIPLKRGFDHFEATDIILNNTLS